MKLLGMELGLDLGLANPKPRNRRRKEGQRWQWPQIDWRRYSFALSGLAGVLAFVALLVIALDQPITSVSVQGRFQRVSPMDVEQAVREHGYGACATVESMGAVALQLLDRHDALRQAARTAFTGVYQHQPYRGRVAAAIQRLLQERLA